MEVSEVPLAPQAAAVGLDIRVVGNDSGEKVSLAWNVSLHGTLESVGHSVTGLLWLYPRLQFQHSLLEAYSRFCRKPCSVQCAIKHAWASTVNEYWPRIKSWEVTYLLTSDAINISL